MYARNIATQQKESESFEKNTIVQTIWHILLCHKKQSLYLLTKQASNLDIRSLVDVETFYKDYIKAIEYYLNHDEFLNK